MPGGMGVKTHKGIEVQSEAAVQRLVDGSDEGVEEMDNDLIALFHRISFEVC